MLKRLPLLLAAGFLLLATPAWATHRVTVYNACHYKVTFMVEHAIIYRDWKPQGWWVLAPGEERRLLNADGTDLIHLNDHSLYLFAFATDDPENTKKRWENSKRDAVTFEGKQYHTMYAGGRKSNDDLHITLTCANN